MAVRGGEVARRTRATRLWNWKKNSTSITIWLGGGELKSPTHSASLNARSKSGSRIGAWNWRRNWEPSKRSMNRRVVSVRNRRVPSATAVTIITRAISITITMRRRRDFINSINNINSTDSRTETSTTSSSITMIYCKPPLRPTTPPTSAKWPPRAWHKNVDTKKKAAYTLSLTHSLF